MITHISFINILIEILKHDKQIMTTVGEHLTCFTIPLVTSF